MNSHIQSLENLIEEQKKRESLRVEQIAEYKDYIKKLEANIEKLKELLDESLGLHESIQAMVSP